MCETLRIGLAEGKPLRIDLSDSGPWDLAGLQVLISCCPRDGPESPISRFAWPEYQTVLAGCRTVGGMTQLAVARRSRMIGKSLRTLTILMSKTVLHADDSAAVRRWVAEQLAEMNLKVISVADGEAVLEDPAGIPVRPAADGSRDAQSGWAVAGGGRAGSADAPVSAGTCAFMPASQ